MSRFLAERKKLMPCYNEERYAEINWKDRGRLFIESWECILILFFIRQRESVVGFHRQGERYARVKESERQ